MAAGLTCLMIIFMGYGYLHFQHKYSQELNLTTQKNIGNSAEKKIVMISDLHLRYHIDRKEFAKWVDRLGAENPDLILVGGDIIDNSVRPLIAEDVAAEFHRLNAPVYACLGNHEYYAGEPQAKKFYEDAGVILLRDSVANVNGINVIGRDDLTNSHRKPLHDLVSRVDTSYYTILLDHQPYHLEEAENAGVDFQFSGHTHYGQVWPISWLTRTMFEQSFGYIRKGNTEYYISSSGRVLESVGVTWPRPGL